MKYSIQTLGELAMKGLIKRAIDGELEAIKFLVEKDYLRLPEHDTVLKRCNFVTPEISDDL